jgi:hypothetical protein
MAVEDQGLYRIVGIDPATSAKGAIFAMAAPGHARMTPVRSAAPLARPAPGRLRPPLARRRGCGRAFEWEAASGHRHDGLSVPGDEIARNASEVDRTAEVID